jgi:serine/threonine protein kinase
MSEFIGKVLADKYRVESVMRESGMGTIFRGSHLLMDKPVAIKILSPALAVDDNIVQRFSVEARTVSRLTHPNVLNITDYGTDKNDVVFIVMEYAEGETLKHAIAEDGKFSLERAGNIINQVASALSTAHAQGIIHRNLNSENILLTKTPTEKDIVKILDFGTVRIDESDISDRKPEYLSPEQCSESSEADERSDIYSLGVILYEMLAGEVPFIADTPTDVMLKHVQEPPPPILSVRNDLPTEVENIVQRALAKQPVQRFQSATDLSDALKRIGTNNFNEIEQETVFNPKIEEEVPMQPPIVAKPYPQPQNNMWKTAFIVLAGICALGAGLVFMTNSKRTEPELQTDINGIPVQPVNPATGMTEQTSANYNSATGQYGVNGVDPGVQVIGTDGPDLWKNGRPPAGAPVGSAPYPVPPSSYPQGVPPQTGIPTVDGNSQFTTDYELRPVNANANVKLVKIGNTNVKVNANVQIKPNANTNVKVVPPNANTITPEVVPPANTTIKPAKPVKGGKPSIKVVPTPQVEKPADTPKETPKPDKPPTSTKTTSSGKPSDAQ